MDLETVLRSHGCRVTAARRTVWDVLSASHTHMSAQAITNRVHDIDPAINESSVYRTLTLFTEIGLARESRLDDAAAWEPFHDDTAIHLVCSSCGLVVHHNTEIVHQLRHTLDQVANFSPTTIDVSVSGFCDACA